MSKEILLAILCAAFVVLVTIDTKRKYKQNKSDENRKEQE